MQIINISQYKDALKHVCFRRNDVVGCIGPSGCGKTEGSEQATLEYKDSLMRSAIYLPFLLGQYESVDMRGFPGVRTHVTGHQDTVWYPASTLPFKGNPAFDENGPLIHVHLDEITSAKVDIMGNCYQLLQARRLGEHILMDNVRLSCSGNRISDKGIVNRMPSPLDNRITWYETVPTVKGADGWVMHARSRGVSEVILAYLSWQSDDLMTFDPAKPEKAFATGRSWMKAAGYWDDTTMPEWLREASISGAIGAGVTAKLLTFKEHWKMVKKLMPSILKNPATAEIPTELSMQYAVSISISGDMSSDANCKPYNIYFDRISSEFGVMAWTLATARDEKLYKTQSFVDFSKKNKMIWEENSSDASARQR
jgi:hypothetical protein